MKKKKALAETKDALILLYLRCASLSLVDWQTCDLAGGCCFPNVKRGIGCEYHIT